MFVWPDSHKPLSRLYVSWVLCGIIEATDPDKAPEGPLFALCRQRWPFSTTTPWAGYNRRVSELLTSSLFTVIWVTPWRTSCVSAWPVLPSQSRLLRLLSDVGSRGPSLACLGSHPRPAVAVGPRGRVAAGSPSTSMFSPLPSAGAQPQDWRGSALPGSDPLPPSHAR